jgi:hypothetical protein
MFRTQNDALVYIAEAVQNGTFQDCVHLTPEMTAQTRTIPWEPYCAKRNFDRSGTRLRCPDPCLSFEDRTAAARAQKRAKLWKFLGSAWKWVCRGVWRWLDWFKGLPAIQASVVLAIVLVVVAYFWPQVEKKFIELYNEVRGK